MPGQIEKSCSYRSRVTTWLDTPMTTESGVTGRWRRRQRV